MEKRLCNYFEIASGKQSRRFAYPICMVDCPMMRLLLPSTSYFTDLKMLNIFLIPADIAAA